MPGSTQSAAPSFMGIQTVGSDVVYVLDFSGSMKGGKIEFLKRELARSVGALTPTNTFQVVPFASSLLVNPHGTMLPGTSRNKRASIEWVNGTTAMGGTNPVMALERTLAVLRPDVVFLLTDGEFEDDRAVLDVVKRNNSEGAVRVHTIGFGDDVNEGVLRRIAAENGGTYAFVESPSS